MNDPQDPHSSGLTYDLDVKEQDRWLPIANGMSWFRFLSASLHHDSRVSAWSWEGLLPLKPARAWRRLASKTAAHSHPGLMSHDSPSKSPEAPRASSTSGGSKADRDRYDVYDANIRNFAPVARIMKNALPENAKIAKEAKECMQECVSEFISFITSEGTSLEACRAASGSEWELTYHSLGEVPSRKEKNSQW